MNESRYYRYGHPNKYDQLPYGSTIIHIKNSCNSNDETYLQCNKDSESPLWVKVQKEGLNTALSDVCDSSERKGLSSEA